MNSFLSLDIGPVIQQYLASDMLEQHFRHIIDRPLESLAKALDINPNALTVTGMIINIAAAFEIPRSLFAGGLLILAGGFFDMFDGISARVNNRRTEFGGFLDSVIDRYSDSFLFLGFAWHFYNQNSFTGIGLSAGSLVGALLISYARARAEAAGIQCKVGLMERPERVVLLAFAAITGLVLPVMWVMLVLTHFTVIQRIMHVRKI